MTTSTATSTAPVVPDVRHAPLIVVGGGPVGLATALCARALDVGVVVLEADPADRVRPGSRALYLHRETLRLLDRAAPGTADALAERAITWTGRRTVYGGRTVFASRAPATGGRPFVSLRQPETEAVLRAACKAAGVEIRFDHGVSAVDVDPDGVELRDGHGGRWRADYVVGADGARSAVRRAVGLELHGPRSTGFHVVVDVADPGEHGRERVFHYEHPALGGRHVLVVPFGGGFQVDLQARADDDPADLASPEGVARWLPSVVPGVRTEDVLWISHYHFLQKVADRMIDAEHRVLLVGEAAHLFPPFGARGLNSGVADADAAASAVAAALSARPDRAREAIADYDRLRRPAAWYNAAAAGRALAHLRPASPVVRWRQRLAALGARVVRRCGRWLETAPYGPAGAPPTNPTGRY